MAEYGGDAPATGQVAVTRHVAAALEKAIADAASVVSFGRAWMTAIQNEDGSITATAHATAVYDHRGDKRECHVAFEIDHDDAIGRAFGKALQAAAPALVAAAMKDAATCYVAALNSSTPEAK